MLYCIVLTQLWCDVTSPVQAVSFLFVANFLLTSCVIRYMGICVPPPLLYRFVVRSSLHEETWPLWQSWSRKWHVESVCHGLTQTHDFLFFFFKWLTKFMLLLAIRWQHLQKINAPGSTERKKIYRKIQTRCLRVHALLINWSSCSLWVLKHNYTQNWVFGHEAAL